MRKKIVAKFFSCGKIIESKALEFLLENEEVIELALEIDKNFITLEDVQKLKSPKEEKEKQEIVVIRREEKPLSKEIDEEIKVIKKVEAQSKERKAKDFALYFNSRLNLMKELLMKRIHPISISHLKEMQEEQEILGLVYEKRVSPTGNLILTLEDGTGYAKCLINKENGVFKKGEEILEDEVIGVRGIYKNGYFFVNEIFQPEIPAKDKVLLDLDIEAVFISDLHVGSVDFLEEIFLKFIKWLKESEEAKKVKYVFICGDIVDGVGIYGGQEKDLTIKDIYKQYEKAYELLSLIPEHIKLVIAPGNHDIVGIPEPQPSLKETALSKLTNALLVTNPCYLQLHNKLTLLMYHGYSYDGIIQSLPSLRKSGYQNPALPMVEVLKRRHLSPRMEDTLIVPNERDYLVIDIIPDIFHSGHLHTTAIMNYKHITLINSGTFQAQTEYQRMLGHIPHPGIIAKLNLKTREAKLINFCK